LFILGEYYDHEKDGMINIESQINKDDVHYNFLGINNPRYLHSKLNKTIPGLLYYLYRHYDPNFKKNAKGYVEENLELNKTKIPEIFEQAQESYSKCGMIDIKKDSASLENNKLTIEKILQAINNYADIINKQIESISPNLIIVGGQIVLIGLQKGGLLPFKLKEKPRKGKPPIVKEFNGKYYIFTSHPTDWWGHEEKYLIYKTIVDNINL